jgi:hypothetical protein
LGHRQNSFLILSISNNSLHTLFPLQWNHLSFKRLTCTLNRDSVCTDCVYLYE